MKIFAHIISYLVFYFYKYIISELLIILLKLLMFIFPKKIQLLLQDRQHASWVPLLSSPIWLHAASGEIEYAKPVLRALKQKFPEHPILLTYFSPSAKKLIMETGIADHIMPLPFDQRHQVIKFLNFYKPKVLLISRTDLWPTFIDECKKRNIFTLLFSATISSQKKSFMQLVWSYLSFRKLTDIYVVSKTDQENLYDLADAEKISVVGDTRIDQVIYRLQHPRLSLNERPIFDQRPLFVAGSTWPEDESKLIPALAKLKDRGLISIIASHEVDEARLNMIETLVKRNNLKSIRFQNISSWQGEDIILLDQVGILADIYAWGIAAFVGGSFREKVHSVLEPLVHGKAVIVGPYHQNNREAIEFQQYKNDQNIQFVTCCLSSDDIERTLRQILAAQPQILKVQIQAEVKSRQLATLKVLSWCQEKIRLPG